MATLDWVLIRRNLADACLQGYNPLLHSLIGMNTIYKLQHAKALNSTVHILGLLVDQFKFNTNSMRQQQEMDRTFQKDLTRQLNSFSTGVAKKIDFRTLELSRPCPRKTGTSTTSPTVDSVSSHQSSVPGKIHLTPFSTYKSEFLTVTFGPNEEVTVIPTVARAKILTSLVSLNITKKTLVNILKTKIRI